MAKKVYSESQSFITWWLCLFFMLIVGLNIYVATRSDGSKLSDFSIGIGIGLLLTVVFFLMRLRTRIDDKGVHVRFFPFLWKEKTWRWEDIGDVYLKKYSPWEYGGWGYRFGKGGTTAFTTKGYYGIHFVVKKNGSAILVGTQKPEEVESILKEYK